MTFLASAFGRGYTVATSIGTSVTTFNGSTPIVWGTKATLNTGASSGRHLIMFSCGAGQQNNNKFTQVRFLNSTDNLLLSMYRFSPTAGVDLFTSQSGIFEVILDGTPKNFSVQFNTEVGGIAQIRGVVIAMWRSA